MRKVLVIASVLLLTLAIGPGAFAGELQNPAFYGNAQSGSISFGTHGHSWYADGNFVASPVSKAIVHEPEGKEQYYFVPEGTQLVQVKGVYQDNSGETGHWYYSLDSSGKKHYYFVARNSAPVLVKGVYQDNSGMDNDSALIWDLDRDGQWEFYKDASGVLHYFYVDPDREGQYQRYTDQNGATQYNYQYTV
ncbi:MAG: hypothetical protein ACYDEQ_04530 [Desulfocucumaceae bacterium]